MQSYAHLYEASVPGVSTQQSYTLYASTYRFDAVFFIFYGIELFCLVISKLMLLGRLASNATQSS
jgi:hypothetical protein